MRTQYYTPYAQPTWVLTRRTLPMVPGGDVRLVEGDVRSVHEAMQKGAGGKNLWMVGGGDLARPLQKSRPKPDFEQL